MKNKNCHQLLTCSLSNLAVRIGWSEKVMKIILKNPKLQAHDFALLLLLFILIIIIIIIIIILVCIRCYIYICNFFI